MFRSKLLATANNLELAITGLFSISVPRTAWAAAIQFLHSFQYVISAQVSMIKPQTVWVAQMDFTCKVMCSKIWVRFVLNVIPLAYNALGPKLAIADNVSITSSLGKFSTITIA